MTTLKNIPDKIFQEQVRLLYANTMIMIIVSVMASFLLCWSLRTIIEQTVLVTWFSVFLTISIVRIFLLLLSNKRRSRHNTTKRSYIYFLIGTYVAATVWGSASLFLFPEHSLSQQIVFFMIMVGVAAGGLASLCPRLPVVVGFLTLILMPLGVRMMTLGSEDALFNLVG